MKFRISSTENKLQRMSDMFGGNYDNWHIDKDSIGYMYDKIYLMQKAELKDSNEVN